MKSLKYVLAVLALTSALAVSAKADLQFLGAVDFNNGPNNPDNNRAALGAFLGKDTSTWQLCTNDEDLNGGNQNIDVHPGEYLVVHYGKGRGGTGSGGSWEFFQVINGETNVTVPGTGGTAGNDPFGHGGISSIRGFCPPSTTTPDSGTTAALLGLGLTGLAGLRARFGRK